MSPNIPPDVVLKSTIRPGSVYYFPDEALYSPDPHYFIVINTDPLNEPVILMVCSSTRKYKVRTRRISFPPESIVEITTSKYSDFPYSSVIDCNNVFERSIDILVQRLGDNKLQLKKEMDISLVEELRKGVLSSPIVATHDVSPVNNANAS